MTKKKLLTLSKEISAKAGILISVDSSHTSGLNLPSYLRSKYTRWVYTHFKMLSLLTKQGHCIQNSAPQNSRGCSRH